MTDRTITLPANLVERFEQLADQQRRSLDDLFAELLSNYAPTSGGNWALAVTVGMEAADIDWIVDPDASAHSRELFKRHLNEKWRRTQNMSGSDA